MKRELSKTPLIDLEQAVVKGDLRSAFAIAVTEWRRGRQPKLADVACAIGSRLELPPNVRVPRGGKDVFQKTWVELAATRDPLALGPLLSALTKACPTAVVRSPVDIARQRFAAWLSRIDALAKFDDDPRMTDALVELIRDTPFTSRDLQTGDWVYEPAIVLLERLRDARCLPVLRGLVERPASKTVNLREYLARRLPVAIKTIESSKSAALDARIDAIASAIGLTWNDQQDRAKPKASSAASEKELLEAVVLATTSGAEDPGPWEVLSDHWLESGDPRGELASLQLAYERDPSDEALQAEMRKKVPALLRKDKDWLEPELARITKNRIYRRGLLDSFDLLPTSAATAAAWKIAASSPHLDTVRQVGQGAANADLITTFLTTGAMRSLSDVATRSESVLEQMSSTEALARRLVHLTLERIPTDAWLTTLTRDRFPSLERLRIIPGDDEAVEVDELLERLARWKHRPPLGEITLVRASCPAFLLGHDGLADVTLAIASDSWKRYGFWADGYPDMPRLAVRPTTVKGKSQHALEARMHGHHKEFWEAIEAVARTRRFDQVTFEPLGAPDAKEDLPKALVHRVLTALGRTDSILPDAWRA